MVEERLIDLGTPSIAVFLQSDGARQAQARPGVQRDDGVGRHSGCGTLGHNLAAPRRTIDPPTVLKEKGTVSWRLAVAIYVEGWMKADARQIAAATAEDYNLDDPLLGEFSRKTLPTYFSLVANRLRASGNITQHDLSFRFHGPMPNGERPDQLLFWREAPGLGLSGTSTITVDHSGIFRERISYDLNMATEVLRRPCAINGADHATTESA